MLYDEAARKKLLYRSVHRGCKETDYILGNFASYKLDKLTDEELLEYEKIVNLDDDVLYKAFLDESVLPDFIDHELWKSVIRPPRVFIVAGEKSGEVLGAKIIRALRALRPDTEVCGIGGAEMREAGCDIVFDCSQIAVMGYIEILSKIPKILGKIKEAEKAIVGFSPDVVVTIDSLGFNIRLARRLRGRYKMIHCVAPSVWAYRPGRAKTLAKYYDHLMVLFGFEKKYFEEEGLETTVIGHPIVEQKVKKVPREDNLVVFMPGSRESEVRTIGATFAESAVLMPSKWKKVVLCVEHLADLVKEVFKNTDVEITTDFEGRYEWMQRARVGVIKSGTGALEAAYYGLPSIVCYKMSRLTYFFLKRLIKIEKVSLPNILLGKNIVCELIQSDCNAERIMVEAKRLMETDMADDLYSGLEGAMCSQSGEVPSMMAAKLILGAL